MAWSKEQITKIESLQPDLPMLFAIVSWGCTATHWLAATLNSLPDIFCVHHLYNRIQQVHLGSANLKEEEYFRALRFSCMGYELVGDAHSISSSAIPRLRQVFGEGFEAAVVVRDPLSRLQSQYGLLKESEKDQSFTPDMRYIEACSNFALIRKHLTGKERWFFAHAVCCLNAINEEAQCARIFKHEDLTSDPVSLACLVEHISQRRKKLDIKEYRPIPTNKFRHSHAHREPVFEQWQLEIIRRLFQPKAAVLYEKLGYLLPKEWA